MTNNHKSVSYKALSTNAAARRAPDRTLSDPPLPFSSGVPSQLPSQEPSLNPPVLGQWLLSWTQSHEYAVMSMLSTSPSKQLGDLPPPADLLLQENPSVQPLVIHTCPSHSQSKGSSSMSLHSTLKAPGHCWPSTRLMHTMLLYSKLGLMILSSPQSVQFPMLSPNDESQKMPAVQSSLLKNWPSHSQVPQGLTCTEGSGFLGTSS